MEFEYRWKYKAKQGGEITTHNWSTWEVSFLSSEDIKDTETVNGGYDVREVRVNKATPSAAIR